MAQHPERLLPTVLLGNNLVNTAAAALGTAIAISILKDPDRGVIASTIGVTLLLLILGETVPKTIGARHAERLAFLSVRPLEWVEWGLFPLARGLQWISRGVARLLGGDTRSPVTEEEIRVLISVGKEAGAVERAEAEMLEKVFHFGDRQVREVMTPRTEIVWVAKDTTLQEFLGLYAEHAHTRFPVFEGSVDNVIGIISVKDVVRALAQGDLKSGDSVTRILRPVTFVPETKTVGRLFSELRRLGQQMAIVVDEFGGVAGLVTLKQLVEVIVGPVGEEGLPAEEEFEALGEDTYRLDGGMSIQDVNEKLGLDLPEGDYQTLAGFILEQLGHIPREGEHFHYRDLTLAIKEMKGLKIEKVEVRRALQKAGGGRG
jgi:putative hemolysin